MLLAGLVLAIHLAIPATAAMAADAPDYRGLVNRIEALLGQAAKDYDAGKVDAAKTAVQRSYFEIFENLEGPIRVNLSAQRSYELEAEFGDIRKMMIDGAPAAEVTARIDRHVAALDAVVPALEDGFVLRAERAAGAPPMEEAAPASDAPVPAAPQVVEPYWEDAVAAIRTDLEAAADAQEAGDAERAKTLITRAQFDGYKNSLLETAIRRYVSQSQDIAYNAEFQRILGLAEAGRPARLIRGSARVLAEDLTTHLPGLPLVGAAKEEAAKAPRPQVDWAQVHGRITDAVGQALRMAETDADAAVSLLQDTYFDIFEATGMEGRIGARDPAFKTRIEAHFSKLMALARDHAPAAALEAEAKALDGDLAAAVDMLGGTAGDWLTLFGYALLIILREGFEAMLIVTALLTYLVKIGHADKQRVIVNSVVVALLASVATAILLKGIFRASAASQELLEGGTMLVAAVILFTMSYWLISKAEAEKWSAYIKGKVRGSLTSGSVTALWFTSFLAVYREGAETVLFFQALTIDATDATGVMGIAAGFAVGCVGLAVLYWAMRAGALRLPIRPFFQATSALLYFMAFVFIGKGVMELVEGKVLSPTLIPWAPDVPALGLYPYWQSLLPQVALVAAALIALAVVFRRKRDAPATQPAEGRPG
jgi:high-affinity iron transporter